MLTPKDVVHRQTLHGTDKKELDQTERHTSQLHNPGFFLTSKGDKDINQDKEVT